MRDYAKISPTFWTGKTGRALKRRGSEASLVALYLVSSPHSNMLGLFYQPVLYLAEETGLTIEGASKGLQGCVEAGFCSYDEDTKTVWVHEMAAWQIADALASTDKRCKGIQKDYDGLPDNPFLAAWFDRYQRAFNLTRKREFEGDESGYSEAPSKPLRSQEQEQEHEQDLSNLSVAPAFPKPEKLQELQQPTADQPKGPPDCPHGEVLSLWAEVLPHLPQHNPAMWSGTRADHLRARWRDTARLKAWESKADGLAYFRKLFAYVGASPFLTGRSAPAAGKRPFVIELEWLVNPTNWAKVHEGKYHQEAA